MLVLEKLFLLLPHDISLLPSLELGIILGKLVHNLCALLLRLPYNLSIALDFVPIVLHVHLHLSHGVPLSGFLICIDKSCFGGVHNVIIGVLVILNLHG